ncbi:MAG: type II secretion system protein [Lentisphaerota bacterium]
MQPFLICFTYPKNATRHELRIANCFTMVELLVVIAIIAILASMLISALYNAKLVTKSIVCIGKERQIGLAWSYFSNDNDEWLLGASGSVNRFGGAGFSSNSNKDWPYMISDYLQMPDLPDGYWTGVPAKYGYNSPITCDSMNNGAIRIRYLRDIHYGMPIYNIGGDNNSGYKAYAKQFHIRYPSNLCVIIDSSSNYTLVRTEYSGAIYMEQTYMFSATSNHVDFRHIRPGPWSGLANALIADGHVESKRFKEISPAQWKTDKFWGWGP